MAIAVGVLSAALTVALVALVALTVLALAHRGRARRSPVAAVVTPATSEAEELLGLLPTAVAVVDSSDDPRYANHAARAIGLATPRGLAADLRAQVRETRRDGIARDTELGLRPPDANRAGRPAAWVRARTHRLRDGQVALLVDDITETRRVEAVRRDFVANVGHEIKTPVGAIELLLEAADGAGNDQVAVDRFMARLRVESARLSRLVQEILDLSRLQGGEPLPPSHPVPLRRVVSEAIDRAETAATAKAIRIRSDVEDVLVAGSESQLVTAITNLLDNAVAYSPASTTIAVTGRAAGGWAELAVADQGSGMDPSETARIFERFYRVDPARSRMTGGTGLGLAIVKHIVSNHGGEVRVWSRPGSGSTFTLRLPLAEARGAVTGLPAAEAVP
ncbi:MAG TPA: ATP-binding protein [Mycobacteriales bacterium]|nr:ATP-binding protein [Mycobacteriales bacterium]